MAIFNSDRYGFCVIGNKIVVMDEADRGRGTMDWMTEVIGLSVDELDFAPRGYFLPGRIQFFVGDNYSTCADVNEDLVADAVAVYASLYGVHNTAAIQVPIYNGVHVGNDGDTWPPIMKWDFDIGRWEVYR